MPKANAFYKDLIKTKTIVIRGDNQEVELEKVYKNFIRSHFLSYRRFMGKGA